MRTPRVAAIHDMSGFGRCSLTVAIPVLSAMGLQCCPLPTAFLSTHTGGFEGFSFLDMTDEMPKAAEHWKTLDLDFQCVYSGFLGSERQIRIVSDFIRDFKRSDTVVVVDPVMGDHGQVYQTYTPAMCDGMVHLAEQADVIVPNLTEAALLSGTAYEEALTGEKNQAMLSALSGDGVRSVLITSARGAHGGHAMIGFDAEVQDAFEIPYEPLPVSRGGTGDLFSAVMLKLLMVRMPLADAAQFAGYAVEGELRKEKSRILPDLSL